MQLKFPFPPDRNDRFDNFVTDSHNEKSVAICKDFASGKEGQPSSLVLAGPAGSGKTHLLAAMGGLAAESFKAPSLYLDCFSLVEKVVALEKYEDLKKYLTSYESASFLAVDRLELALGDREAEDQLFHLYNAVTQGGGRFAAATNIEPSDWDFAEWLSTRLLWGHVLTMAPVGDEQKVEVLQKMASDLRLLLPDSCAKWILTHLPRDSKSQLKALSLIDQLSLTTGRKVSIPLIKQALEYTNAG